MGKSSVSTSVTVQLPNKLTALVDQRAAKRGVSRSEYMALLVAKWHSEGCPALDQIDDTARRLVLQEENDKKATAGNKTSAERQFAKSTAAINKAAINEAKAIEATTPLRRVKKSDSKAA